ncbi:MAG TPA: ribonuclease domain-containing protein [Pseudoxanthomonas sp.]|nr:ribonuclease domain-containing protein [Pseudoxanthomonas sp.]
MPRRSRRRGGSGSWGKPLLILVLLALLVGGGYWWYGRGDHTPETQAPSQVSHDGRSEASLPLPPVESTALGDGAAPAVAPAASPPSAPATSVNAAPALPAFLPAEARRTLQLIAQGGPYPHRQDGSVFGNREGRLPAQARGYYHEYTVDTPGLNHRGARRIVTGGNPPSEFYYSDDHYDSFRRFDYRLPEAR